MAVGRVILPAGAAALALAVWALAAALVPAPRVAAPWTHPEAARLRDAGWRAGSARWELVRLGVGAAAATIAVPVGLPVPAMLAAGLALPSVALRLRSDARREAARRASGDQLRAIRSALASGAGLVDALRRAEAATPDAIAARPLASALGAFGLGEPLDQALRVAASGAPAHARPALLTLALGVEERLPVPQLAALVGAMTDRQAFEDDLRADVRARTGGTRAQIWLMAALVPLLSTYLALTVPFVGETLASDLGRFVLLPAAASLELAGVVLAGRAVRGAVG